MIVLHPTDQGPVMFMMSSFITTPHQQIPRIIWQTAKSTPHTSALPLIDTWKNNNPGYHYAFVDDVACDRFIKHNFTREFYEMYSSLPVGVMKADVWRVAVVYVYGGVYADIDCECMVPINTWISNHSLVVAVETGAGALANFTFAAKPKHPALLSVLNRFMELANAPDFLSPESPTPIQDFGQYGFSDGVLRHFAVNDDISMRRGGTSNFYNTAPSIKSSGAMFFTLDERRFANSKIYGKYVRHHVASENWKEYESWRIVQNDLALTKPIKFITTFSKIGYEVYGRTWIDTFSSNVRSDSVTADVYVDFPLTVDDPRINVIDFDTAIPGHKQWVDDFTHSFKGRRYNMTMAVRFSYKSFVMMHALKHSKECYVVWLDGDCVYKSDQNFSNIGELLEGKSIAVQREHNGGNDHCESGIVIFDPDHDDSRTFLKQFTTNYSVDEAVAMDSPYDGFIIYKSLDGIEYTDLNDGYGRGGIQSDPNETFLHPEIHKRFLHNIGPTGKSSYGAWKHYQDKDLVFSMLSGKDVGMTAEDRVAVRQRLIGLRNRIA